MRKGLRQGDAEAGVVELAVGIGDGTDEAFAAQFISQTRHPLQGLLPAQHPAGEETGGAGNPIVELGANGVVGQLPQAEARNQQFQRMGEKRRAAQHGHALMQGPAHQRELAAVEFPNGLLQIADAAVHQLGGGHGGLRDKVSRIQQDGGKSSQLRIQRAAQAGGPAADDAYVVAAMEDALTRAFPAFHRLLLEAIQY